MHNTQCGSCTISSAFYARQAVRSYTATSAFPATNMAIHARQAVHSHCTTRSVLHAQHTVRYMHHKVRFMHASSAFHARQSASHARDQCVSCQKSSAFHAQHAWRFLHHVRAFHARVNCAAVGRLRCWRFFLGFAMVVAQAPCPDETSLQTGGLQFVADLIGPGAAGNRHSIT